MDPSWHSDIVFILREHVVTVLGFLLGLLLVVRILRQHNRPAVSIAWLMAIILIPYVGVPAYLLFGGRKLARLAGRKKNLYDDKADSGSIPGHVELTTERVLLLAGMPPARAGNGITFLEDGGKAYRDLVALIDNARESIHIMTFILGRDKVGKELVRRLARKAEEGVKVRLLLDALGCFYTRGRFVQPVRDAGGHVAIFMPVLPLRRRWSANLRNHRKIVVVDGEAAMIGGMNLAHVYMGPGKDPERWIDTAALVRGPVVADLDDIFGSDWEFATGEAIATAAGPPPDDPPGDAIAQIVASGPDVNGDPLYEATLSATYEARKRIWIVTPYFIPDEGLFKALLLKARLGLDVRVVMPARSNHLMADLARGRFLRQLQAAGGRVMLYEKGMIHAKHVVFDDRIAVVSSANLDMRSLYLNYEDAMFIYSVEDVQRTADWVAALMLRCTARVSDDISPWRRWAEDVGLLVSPLL